MHRCFMLCMQNHLYYMVMHAKPLLHGYACKTTSTTWLCMQNHLYYMVMHAKPLLHGYACKTTSTTWLCMQNHLYYMVMHAKPLLHGYACKTTSTTWFGQFKKLSLSCFSAVSIYSLLLYAHNFRNKKKRKIFCYKQDNKNDNMICKKIHLAED